MSKKSRKRNKKILAAIGLGLGAAAMASKKKADLASTEDGKSGSTKITGGTNLNDYDAGTKKSTVVKTPTTIQDNKSTTPRNPKSIRVKTNTNKVYTDATGGESTAKVGNTKSVFKGEDGYLRQGENATPMTPGKFGTYAARNKKPAMLGLKSGGRVKGCGKALRGFGKAMKGKR